MTGSRLQSVEIDPLFIEDAATHNGVHWEIPIRGALRPLRDQSGNSMESLLPGWKAGSLYNGFGGYPVLQLQSDTHHAIRILDAEARCLGDRVQQMTAPDAARFRQQLLRVLKPALSSLLHDARPQLSPAMSAFLRLGEAVTFALAMDMRLELITEPVTVAAQDLPAIITVSSSLDGRPVPLAPGMMETAMRRDFLTELARAPGGILHWPSPVDDVPIPVQGSVCFSDMVMAYRFHDERHGLVFFVVADNEQSRPMGIYLPQADLLVARDAAHVQSALRTMACHLPTYFISALCRGGEDLISYLRRGASHTINLMRSPPWTHMGHQLWNELSGMEAFLAAKAASTPIPETITPCGAPGLEFYGPVDALFAEWASLTDRRHASPGDAIRHAYRTDGCIVRLTRDFVTTALRARLLRHASATCTCAGEIRGVQERRARYGCPPPILLIGLRVENRTHHDLAGLLSRLLMLLAGRFPGLTVILDGHNTRVGADGEMIVSHGHSAAHEHPGQVEKRITEHLRQVLEPFDITVLDTIGQSMSNSLAWAAASDCFFAIWGAGLAKYRWVANKPGLVLTSRDNLLHRPDLRIYDSPLYTEDPAEMILPEPSWIEDLPGAPVLSNPEPGRARFFNFRVEETPVFDAMIGLVERTAPRLALSA